MAAAILGLVGWHTRRALDSGHDRPEPHRLVNRLVLARASASRGRSWPVATSATRSPGWVMAPRWPTIGPSAMLAGLGGLLVLVMSLLLERACRVRTPDDQS